MSVTEVRYFAAPDDFCDADVYCIIDNAEECTGYCSLEDMVLEIYGAMLDEMTEEMVADRLARFNVAVQNGDVTCVGDRVDYYDVVAMAQLVPSWINPKVFGFRAVRVIVPNTMFLTLKDCIEHIDANGYHYRKPQPYCMCGWRSPRFERVIKLLRTIDFGGEK